ncbi:hypothetical protein CERSUDRAFT_124660 [Gelatoporia subvermispora B]|uniref:F-box domain-containing protein n=1 Tax=Ceriporiopsis subvermispora (strain B) TaxID=914234 RepID=M2RA44_CERS8|nr:hypothetical protein CERSUDRAFT_124660 [Gelatoporia subvermispora B]
MATWSSLPDKALQIIFEDLKDLYMHPRNVSHVCRQWRKVANAHEYLWEDIKLMQGLTPAGVDYVQACLDRTPSSDVGVVIIGTAIPEATLVDKFMDLIEKHRQRIYDFVYKGPHGSSILARVTFPLDVLVALDIHDEPSTESGALWLQPPWVPSKDQFKQLNAICFDKARLAWNIPTGAFSTLLELRLNGYDQGILPTMSELLDLLEGCPSLRVLTMICSLPHVGTPTAIDTKGRILELPQLWSLQLGDRAENVANFLSHVKFPKRQLLRFELYYGNTPEMIATQMLLAAFNMVKHIVGPQALHPGPASMECSEVYMQSGPKGWKFWFKTSISGSRRSIEKPEVWFEVRPHPSAPFQQKFNTLEFSRVLYNIISGTTWAENPPNCVHILWRQLPGGPPAPARGAWLGVFQRLPRLDSLELAFGVTTAQLEALTPGPDGIVVCPLLDELTIYVGNNDENVFLALRECVMQRAMKGRKLHELKLRGPTSLVIPDGISRCLAAAVMHFNIILGVNAQVPTNDECHGQHGPVENDTDSEDAEEGSDDESDGPQGEEEDKHDGSQEEEEGDHESSQAEDEGDE